MYIGRHVWACMCVCMCINTHITHIYECIHLGMYIGRHSWVCMCMHVCIYENVFMHICMYVGRHVCIMDIHTYISYMIA